MKLGVSPTPPWVIQTTFTIQVKISLCLASRSVFIIIQTWVLLVLFFHFNAHANAMSSPLGSPPSSATHLQLQFPEELSESISTILAETNLNAMDDSASDATHDSLAESAYEIISHSSLTNSDDDA